jgi:hypothetical protein
MSFAVFRGAMEKSWRQARVAYWFSGSFGRLFDGIQTPLYCCKTLITLYLQFKSHCLSTRVFVAPEYC